MTFPRELSQLKDFSREKVRPIEPLEVGLLLIRGLLVFGQPSRKTKTFSFCQEIQLHPQLSARLTDIFTFATTCLALQKSKNTHLFRLSVCLFACLFVC